MEGRRGYVGYVPALQQQLRDAGADIRRQSARSSSANDENGKVNGVYAIDAFGDLVQYQAKFVVLATGGFANDDKRLSKHGFNLETLERIGTPGHFGDGVNMVLAAGAAEFTGVCYLKYNRISHQVEVFGPLWTEFCFGGSFLWVNQDCDRFVDESLVFRVENQITQSAPIHEQNGIAYTVFDQTIFEKQIADDKANADEWGVDVAAQWEKIIAEGDGEVVFADATKIQIKYQRTEEEVICSFEPEITTYELPRYRRTNQNTSITLKPAVLTGDK